jgi:hypothetical protein
LNAEIKAKFIPLDIICVSRTFTYEQCSSGFAADQYLVDGCEIFVHNREELYMFAISWHELSRSRDHAAWFAEAPNDFPSVEISQADYLASCSTKRLKRPKHCIFMLDRVIEMVLIKELLSTFNEEVRNALSVS